MDTDVYNALIAAVIADPKNDLPRLVLADFLEENGDADRAEHIRLGCEIAAMQRAGVEDGLERLFARSHSIYRREWLGLAQEDRLAECVVRRGFVEEILCTTEWWWGGACVCGSRRVHPNGTTSDFFLPSCRACDGSGEIRPRGPTVVRQQPVASVMPPRGRFSVFDPDPVTLSFFSATAGTPVALHPEAHMSLGMPPPVFDCLPDILPRDGSFVVVRGTRRQFYEHLSVAMIQWAKEQDGH